METKDMQMSDIEVRSAELADAAAAEDADIETITAEVAQLEERKAQIKAEAEARTKQLEEVVKASVEKESIKEENMEEMITRNSPEYVRAFAKYIQSGDDREVRTLLTENASGTIAVPEFVYEEVKNAWENDAIMSQVKKAFLKGNVKIPFEISSSGATVQTEGQAVSEQTLTLGIVEMKPDMIKKWVGLSNQALRIDNAETYLRYVYSELGHHIAKKAADQLVAKIKACPTASTTTCVGVPVYTSTTLAIGLIANALGKLSDQAENPVLIMNKQTEAAMKAAAYAANFQADPFEGCKVLHNNTMAAFSAATTGVPYIIVGDLNYGALANFPDGEEISVLRDPYTLAASNITRFVGDMYVAIEPVAPEAFVKIVH